MVAYLVEQVRARDLPGAARGRPGGRAARPSRPSAAWAATASATTGAAWTRPSDGRVLPHARPQPRRHRQQGERRAGSTPGCATPRATGTRRGCRTCALTRQGGGRHHRLPDEPEERRLPRPARGPRMRRQRSATRSSASTCWPPACRSSEADAAAGRDGRPPAHAVRGREDDRPLRLLRLPQRSRASRRPPPSASS